MTTTNFVSVKNSTLVCFGNSEDAPESYADAIMKHLAPLTREDGDALLVGTMTAQSMFNDGIITPEHVAGGENTQGRYGDAYKLSGECTIGEHTINVVIGCEMDGFALVDKDYEWILETA